jgi:hypothetical protein
VSFPNVRFIADGTYLYIQKSEDFVTQKITYSSQKSRNFIKEMVFTAADGTFLEIYGPFASDGSHSDQFLYDKILDKNVGRIKDEFIESDEGLLDRGFSRCDDTYFINCPDPFEESRNN